MSRNQLSRTGVYLEMIAKGDHQYSSILTDKITSLANRFPGVPICVRNTAFGPACLAVDMEGENEHLLVDDNGLVPAPWSPALLDALRQLEESEAMPWLTNRD